MCVGGFRVIGACDLLHMISEKKIFYNFGVKFVPLLNRSAC